MLPFLLMYYSIQYLSNFKVIWAQVSLRMYGTLVILCWVNLTYLRSFSFCQINIRVFSWRAWYGKLNQVFLSIFIFTIPGFKFLFLLHVSFIKFQPGHQEKAFLLCTIFFNIFKKNWCMTLISVQFFTSVSKKKKKKSESLTAALLSKSSTCFNLG